MLVVPRGEELAGTAPKPSDLFLLWQHRRRLSCWSGVLDALTVQSGVVVLI